MTYSIRIKKFSSEGLALNFYYWMRKANPHTHPDRPRLESRNRDGYQVWVVEWEVKG